MSDEYKFGLFEAYGIEIEYMIVDGETLNIAPISDRVLTDVAGELTSEFDNGQASWSNELALHVLEFKVTQPVTQLNGMTELFQAQVVRANEILSKHSARLMPTAMHPWMNPDLEMRLWPHDYNPVYESFHRIFNCAGHGWANLQSTHWNLPFRNDAEFARLHAAIRLILPLIPGLAASSPICDARSTGFLDSRLEFYRHNSRNIPSIAGVAIPEAIYTRAEYQERILNRMYRDIAEQDPEGILQHEWLNVRGAIARFERGSIEIRILDVQECPAMDIAIGSLVVATIRALSNELWTKSKYQSTVSTEILSRLFRDSIRVGPTAIVPDTIAFHFGCNTEESLSIGALWNLILQQLDDHETHFFDGPVRNCLETVLHEGTLAQRILSSVESNVATVDSSLEPKDQPAINPIRISSLHRVYTELCDCLQNGEVFLGE